MFPKGVPWAGAPECYFVSSAATCCSVFSSGFSLAAVFSVSLRILAIFALTFSLVLFSDIFWHARTAFRQTFAFYRALATSGASAGMETSFSLGGFLPLCSFKSPSASACFSASMLTRASILSILSNPYRFKSPMKA